MLTQEKLKELLHYCPDTGVFTWLMKPCSNVRAGSVAGTVNKINGYATIKVNRKIYLAHRLAWLYIHGTFPPNDIDHINRVKSDNRLCNLRMATHAENMQNTSMYRNNTSGHVGVSWHKATQKWIACITLSKKQIHIGIFHSLEEAIAARKAAEPQYHQFNHQ